MAIRIHGEFTRPDAERFRSARARRARFRRPVRFVDEESGEAVPPRRRDHRRVRHVAGERNMTYSSLRAGRREIGVEAVRFEHHLAPHPKAVLYQLSEELVEYVEAASPSPESSPRTLFNGKNDRGERMAF